MKARFFSLLAMVLCLASCQKDVDGLDVNVGGDTATISVVLPENAITRAAAAETDSAASGLANEASEELTVTLYIFDENGKPSQQPYTANLAENQLQANFEVRLVPERHYTFVAWAGQKSAKNLFTLGDPTQNDWTITLSDWAAMDESRDAFTGIYSTAKEKEGKPFTSSSDITLNLTRPFAKLRVVTTDMEWLNNTNITPAYAEVTYESELPSSFNAYSQTIGTEVFTKKAHQTFKIKDYTKDVEGKKMTLFTDYILVPESRNVKFTLTVYEANEDGTGKGKEIESTSFVTDIFVERNHLTTIEGDILTDGNNITVTVEENFANADNPNDKPYYIEYKEAGSAEALAEIINDLNASTTNEQTHISLTGDITIGDLLNAGTLSTRANEQVVNLKINAGKTVELDLKGFTISGTDNNTAGNFYLIDNRGTLTISDSSEAKTGAIKLTAKNERNWSGSSVVVANNPGGNLTINSGTIEHLGGTSMAYGVDNLTNGKGTYAETTINGGTIKSPYRAVRQFLNGVEADNILTVNGGVIEGTNKSIWMQDPGKNANTGNLTVKGGELKGDVYLTVTEGSTTWPVEVSIAASTLMNGSKVLSNNNVPAGYAVVEKNGNWVVEYGLVENGNEVTVLNAAGLKLFASQVNSGVNYFAGKTVKLAADIDLNNENWTPIGSASKDHGFMGNFDGNGFVIKNLAITEITADADGYVYAGLFGVTEGTDKDNQNYIKNLVIENVNIATEGHIVAAAIAYPYYTELENIKVQGNVNIKGGNYTAGVLAYTRRLVDAENISIEANAGSSIEGNMTVGGVISDIQTNGGLTANYSNFSASGLTIKAVKSVGGISGIICNQTLNGATVKNVDIVSDDYRKGTLAGSFGGVCEITNAVVENVTGADNFIGGLYEGTASESASITINNVTYTYNNGWLVDGYKILADGLLKKDNEYKVINANGLATLNTMMADKSAGKDVVVILGNDIDFAGKTWIPVDSHADSKFTFKELNGGGHTISNLTINGQAMFTRFAGSGKVTVTIKDVTFDNAKVNSNGNINTSILTVQSYQNVLLDNVDVKNSTICGGYKVAPLMGTVYNESSTTITATLKNCDVENTTVKATSYDFCTTGMVAFVYAQDNDTIAFENCTVTNVKLMAPNDSYKAHAAIYTTGSESLYNEADGVTVTNVTFEAL